MKEKLTIDQKIQIARMATDIVCASISGKDPLTSISANANAANHEELLHYLYGTVTKTVLNEPE